MCPPGLMRPEITRSTLESASWTRSEDSASLTKGLLDDDLIDLEPSIELDVASSADLSARDRRRAGPGKRRQSLARDSLAPPPPAGLGRAFSRGGLLGAVLVEPLGGRNRSLVRIVDDVSQVRHRRGLRGLDRQQHQLDARPGSGARVSPLRQLHGDSHRYPVHREPRAYAARRYPPTDLAHEKWRHGDVCAHGHLRDVHSQRSAAHSRRGVDNGAGRAGRHGPSDGTRGYRQRGRAVTHDRSRGFQRLVPHDRGGPGDLWHVRLEWSAIGSARGQKVRPVSTAREAGSRGDGRSLLGRAPVASSGPARSS